MPSLRRVVLPRALLVMAALLAFALPQAERPSPVPPATSTRWQDIAFMAPRPPQTLAELRADVAHTADRLAAGTLAWEQGRQRLDRLISLKLTTEGQIQDLYQRVAEARQRADAFAAALYRNPQDPLLVAVLSGRVDTINDLASARLALARTQQAQRDDVALLQSQATATQELVRRQTRATDQGTRLQRELDDQLGALQADAAASLNRLKSAQERLRRQAAAAAGTGTGATCSVALPADAVNGFLPMAALCPLKTAPGQRLVAPAAEAFDKMSSAFQAAFGTSICVTDSYRDYQTQVRVFQTKPTLAATPGRSNHGWGRAVDLCGGVQNYGTPPYQWLKLHAVEYGYVHPNWAEPDGSRPEPWHWEYQV